jgi:hypothetical protein
MSDSTTLTTVTVNSPAYECDAYRAQRHAWKLCQDVKAGTVRLREERATYLPRFPSESMTQWDARVKMTFVRDYYAQTLADHVGLVFTSAPKLDEDVPEALADLLENVDGEGTHWEVFAQRAMATQLDLGHVIIVTDYPDASNIKTKADATAAKMRPYWTYYHADDVISWRTEAVGGVVTLTQIVFREHVNKNDGTFGTDHEDRYRVLRQAVTYDVVSGRAVGLGAMTWEIWTEEKDANGQDTYVLKFNGTIVGPKQLPIRIAYGGEKKATLHSEPHLYPLADTVVELTQVQSDYANVMHKCNVPTAIFIGRPQAAHGKEVVMGEGMDIPLGGDAKWLEPQGTALASTQARILNLEMQLRRQGAFISEPQGTMTATEAALYAKQRSAKLVRAARSLQDALEGALQDMGAFMNIENTGSIEFDLNFGISSVNAQLLAVYVQAYKEGALPLEALLTALKDGKLSDEFDVEDAAIEMLAAKDEQDAADAEAAAAKLEAIGNAPMAPGAPKAPDMPMKGKE